MQNSPKVAKSLTQAKAGLKHRTKETNDTVLDQETRLKAFWTVQVKGSNGHEILSDIKIDYLLFYELLYAEGYRRFDINNESVFVKISNDWIIKRVRATEMMDTIKNFTDSLPAEFTQNSVTVTRRDIQRVVVTRLDALFNDKRLLNQLSPRNPIEFNKDTLTQKFIYFNNGFLEITKETIKFLKYTRLSAHIWESEVLNRDWVKPTITKENDVVRKFFSNVSNQNDSRFRDLMSITGYLMHNYTDYKLKMPLLTDSRMDDEGLANGRSGKTLYARMVGGVISNNPVNATIKSYVEINGKDFDPQDKHKYSACDLDTKLVVLNDLKAFFDVDNLYNDITEGITIDKKGLHPFKTSIKMLGITNKTVKIEGGSSKDRFIEFEFADHYSDNHTPEMEFGHWFFRDWDNDAYCRYYYFMALCVHEFFKNDCKISAPEQINLNARKLTETTSREFLEYITEDWKPAANQSYLKQYHFDAFKASYPDYNNSKFTQRRFTEWVKNFMRYSPDFDPYNKNRNESRTAAGDRSYVFTNQTIDTTKK